MMGAAFFNQIDLTLAYSQIEKIKTNIHSFFVVHCVKMILKFKVLWFLSMNNSLIDFVIQNIVPIVLVSVSLLATSYVQRSTCST